VNPWIFTLWILVGFVAGFVSASRIFIYGLRISPRLYRAFVEYLLVSQPDEFQNALRKYYNIAPPETEVPPTLADQGAGPVPPQAEPVPRNAG